MNSKWCSSKLFSKKKKIEIEATSDTKVHQVIQTFPPRTYNSEMAHSQQIWEIKLHPAEGPKQLAYIGQFFSIHSDACLQRKYLVFFHKTKRVLTIFWLCATRSRTQKRFFLRSLLFIFSLPNKFLGKNLKHAPSESYYSTMQWGWRRTLSPEIRNKSDLTNFKVK